MMRYSVCVRRHKGMLQGGPLLANLLLDDLDTELEDRGHRFCRYVDDCSICVRTQRAGERVIESVERFLAEWLRAKVNAEKSAVACVDERQLLGYQLLREDV